MSIQETATQKPLRNDFRIFDRVLGGLQSLGRSLMLPIAVMPVAALLLRLGQPDMFNISWIAAAGDAVFVNLPVIFALGVAIGLTNGAGAAGLAALIGFFVFMTGVTTFVPLVDGSLDPSLQKNVLPGFIVGLVAAGLYKRFHDIRLPDYIGFFGGRRFVPIITAVVTLFLGLLFGLIWGPVRDAIAVFGNWFIGLGAIGTFIYGFLNRLLIPLGLHQVLNSFVWFQLGSFAGPDGVVHGDLYRYFAGDPTAGSYMAGMFPMMMFGLPAACLAMIRQARLPKIAAGILLTAAFTSFLTGITEPVEFAFMFVAPVLFFVHAILTGTAMAVCTLLEIKIGFGFSAGFIDFALNFTKANTTNPWLLIIVGLVYAVIYYFLFSICIKVFNLATPGRGDDSKSGLGADWILPESQRTPKASASTKAEVAVVEGEDADDALAKEILGALGGKDNIESVEGCITRIRLFVKNSDVINESQLKSLGAAGVVKRGRVVQVVMGTQSDRLAERMKKYI